MAEITGQLVRVVARLEARLSALEEKSDQVTILHRDALCLQRAIRDRAAQIGERYRLSGDAIRKIRAEIKKDALRQYGIRDLHDLPARMLPACRLLIERWSSLAAIKKVMGC